MWLHLHALKHFDETTFEAVKRAEVVLQPDVGMAAAAHNHVAEPDGAKSDRRLHVAHWTRNAYPVLV